MNKSNELLQKVIDYYEGKGEFNFSHLSDYDRSNASFDAWQLLINDMKEHLSNVVNYASE